jgi:Uroporphyrinogen decarboxylase (URO-D)
MQSPYQSCSPEDARPNQDLGRFHAALRIHRAMEVERTEYLDHMTFKANKRPLFTEIFGPLVGLKEEWTAQGAIPEELDMSAFRYRRAMAGGVPVNTGWMGGQREEVLEETNDYVIARDRMGRTAKLFKATGTLPLPLDHPVKTMDDWLRIRHRYAFSEERFGVDWEKTARDHAAAGRVVTVSIPGGFDEPRQLMGEEGACMAYCMQPELMHDIIDTIGDTAHRVLDRVSAAVSVDQLSVHEDMAGKSGPLAGPGQIREFIAPYYRRCWNLLASRGARLFMQDSDGDMSPVIPAFLDAGVNLMHPLEPAAGMDIVKIRDTYGTRLALEGGIDKFVIQRGREAIERELEYKIPPMVRSGGCVLGLDHRIPNGTPLDGYRFYIEKAWEILERETARLAP